MAADENQIKCSYCDQPVAESDDFCPKCGRLFADDVFCENHPEIEADGVCVICATPFCHHCGSVVNGKFLCEQHAGYEIYQNLARVYGVSDDSQAQYVKNCLEEAGLHPFIFSRKAGPWHMGSGDYTLFRASGEYDGHIINEVKVMVPLQEVIEAEKTLKDLEIIQ